MSRESTAFSALLNPVEIRNGKDGARASARFNASISKLFKKSSDPEIFHVGAA
jgi:hypothetical protein